MSTFLRPLASHVSAARMQLNRLLKIAAALAAFWVLAFSNPGTAATELVTNGNFDNNTYVTRYGTVANDWPLPFIGDVVEGPTLWYCNPTIQYCSMGYPYVQSNWAMIKRPYVYSADWASAPILSQLINGLKIGHKYAVSFGGWGESIITNPSVAYWSTGGFWQVSLTDSLGRTQKQNGPIEIQPADRFTTQSSDPFVRHTVTFTATDVMETLGFGQGAGPALMILNCVPCHQYMSINHISMTEVSSPPTLTVQEAMSGNRVADSDQFTAQITQNATTIVNATTNSTTTGAGSTVTSGTGTTGLTTLVTGTSYTITEAASGTAKLPQYSSTLSCLRNVSMTLLHLAS